MQTELAGEIITLTFDVAVFVMLRATNTLLALLLRSIMWSWTNHSCRAGLTLQLNDKQ